MDKIDEIIKKSLETALGDFYNYIEKGDNEYDSFVKSYGNGMRMFWNDYVENSDLINSQLKKYIN
jgi:hypothetical protein